MTNLHQEPNLSWPERVLHVLAAFVGTRFSALLMRWSRRRQATRTGHKLPAGFVVIQMDGISYDHLRTALERGYAPHLRRLLDRQEMMLHPWKPGIPGTTPASQAGIMFGSSDAIPAYRWFDKQMGQIRVSSQPGTAQTIQSELASLSPGILRGGSSYMNIFDGGAATSLFTMGTYGGRRWVEGLRALGSMALFVLNPYRGVIVIALSAWEYLTDLAQRIHATVTRSTPRPLSRMFPFLRVISNVIMREIQTYLVSLDIIRGVPAIYSTYYGYDELAHHYGPLSKPALRALRAIDSRIHRIDRLRRTSDVRPYDLYLLSDHGMTEDVPFSIEYHQTLGQFVQDLVGRSVAIRELMSRQQADLPSTLFVQQELEAVGSEGRPFLAHLSQALAQYVQSRVPVDGDTPDLEPPISGDVVVSSSGSLSHIYLTARPERLDLGEIRALYPALIASLLAHPGIWLVVGRDAGRATILAKEGMTIVADDTRREGLDPFRHLAYGAWAERQIARLALLPASGDLLLFGTFHADEQRVSCFENQWACHGGLGGPQDMAVILTEPHITWPLASLERAAGLYSCFAEQYGISARARAEDNAAA